MSALRAEDLSSGGSTVLLTRMRRRHLRAVLRIEAQSEAPGWSAGLFMSELARADDRCYIVARKDGAVVGFAGMLYTDDGGHVTTLAVDPPHRRAQIGTRLLMGLVRDAIARGVDALTLEVRASNRAAQALYGRFGFVPVGARKAYYREPTEDAIVMWAHDVGTPEHLERLRGIDDGIVGATLAEGVEW